MKKLLMCVMLVGCFTPSLFAAPDTKALSINVASKAQQVQKNHRKEVSALQEEVLAAFENFKKSVASVHYSNWSVIFQAMIPLRDAYLNLRNVDATAARDVAPLLNEKVSIDEGKNAIQVESYCNMESVMLYSKSQDRVDFDKFQVYLEEDLANVTVTDKIEAELHALSLQNPSYKKEINAIKEAHSNLVTCAERRRDLHWSQSLLDSVEDLNEALATLKLKNDALYQKCHKLCNHAYGSLENLAEVESEAEGCLNGFGEVRTVEYYEKDLKARKNI
jgi:hypothetical protein